MAGNAAGELLEDLGLAAVTVCQGSAPVETQHDIPLGPVPSDPLGARREEVHQRLRLLGNPKARQVGNRGGQASQRKR